MEPRHKLAPFFLNKLLSFHLIPSVLAVFCSALFPRFENVRRAQKPSVALKPELSLPNPGREEKSFSREATHA